MNHATAPGEDDDDAYVFVDHREDEIAITEAVSERLAPEHALEAVEGAEDISVVYQGRSYVVPLQFSPHDRYIMISSLAHLLREQHRFFVLKPSLDSDTHGLLVARLDEVARWGGIPGHLVPLELGFDYFHDIRVPYLGGEDAAPGFAEDRQRVGESSAAMGGFVEAMMSGKMSDELAAKMASLALRSPKVDAELQGMSEAEIAAQIQRSFKESLETPEMIQARQERDAAMAELKALIHRPKKPWWRFW